MNTFDRKYAFHRLFMKPEKCLQGGSFQRFHDPFYKKRVLYQHFRKI